MKRTVCLIGFLVMIVLMISGCVTTPEIGVWRPWTRSLGDAERIIEGSKVSVVSVSGDTEPLLGQETLLEENIKQTMIRLLDRKAVVVDNKNPDFKLFLRYKTIRQDKTQKFSMYQSGGYSGTVFSSQSFSGVLSATAQAVASHAQTKTTVAEQSFTERSYVHSITLEIQDKEGALVWKGDSYWDSSSLNMENEIVAPLRLLYNVFPSDISYVPAVRTIKKDKLANYYRLYIKRKWFTSPMLPYRISFDNTGVTNQVNFTVNRAEVLTAYVDAILHSEYVLPIGRKDYADPLDDRLWSRVIIGGKYTLLPENKLVNVLIELRGEAWGYFVRECQIVNDEQYSRFQARLKIWQIEVRDYYDMLE